jgi:LmbE family N-acetylglucosaminyl deacetylase
MNFINPQAGVFVPDRSSVETATERTTHLGIGAHPDDLEFFGWHPILQCFEHSTQWYTGVVASDGRSCPRSGQYCDYGDEEMVQVRLKEQKHAATVGEYSCLISLLYSETGEVMQGSPRPLVEDLKLVLSATKPDHIVTHNLADSHPHHLVVALAAVTALRELDYHPETFYGGEIWRALDWLTTTDKLIFDVSSHQNLSNALMGVYDSQITGGKRYDLATAGRKRANATYYDPLSTDTATALEYGMDLMPLLRDRTLSPSDYVSRLIKNFRNEVSGRLKALQSHLDSM